MQIVIFPDFYLFLFAIQHKQSNAKPQTDKFSYGNNLKLAQYSCYSLQTLIVKHISLSKFSKSMNHPFLVPNVAYQ